MCSNAEEDRTIPERKSLNIIGRSCMKCEEPAIVIIRLNDAFCRNCFVQYCTHKFRSAFGKSKLIRDGEDVLVAFSGGINSAAMVHLIQEGLSKRAQKKLRFRPTLLYIDEGGIVGQTRQEREAQTNEVMDVLKKSGLPCETCTLEQSLGSKRHTPNQVPEEGQGRKVDCSDSEGAAGLLRDGDSGSVRESVNDVAGQSHGDSQSMEEKLNKLTLQEDLPEGTLEEILSSCRTLTAKQNLILFLRHRLLVQLARRKGLSKVLLGDSATRLSIRIFSNITQGRGAHLAYETSFADGRHGDVMFVRPLREFTNKELAVYNNIHDVGSVFIPSLSTKASSQASLERLCEDFVVGLQASFPSTVSTVFRTGEKLHQQDMSSVTDENKCVLCQGSLDTDVGKSSALSATLFSQALSQTRASDMESRDPNTCNRGNSCDTGVNSACCGEGDGSCQSKNLKVEKEQLIQMLCYGCRLVVKDMDEITMLPESILQGAAQITRRKEMKATIQDFLLSEDQDT